MNKINPCKEICLRLIKDSFAIKLLKKSLLYLSSVKKEKRKKLCLKIMRYLPFLDDENIYLKKKKTTLEYKKSLNIIK